MRIVKGKLQEDLAVIWQDFDSGDWAVTRVTGYKTSEDADAPKRVTGLELVSSRIFSSNVIKAGSKHEALLKYVASGHTGNVWSIAGDEVVLYRYLSPMEHNTIYSLVKEDF